ncbi:hypothetical protein MUK42_37403 [Musa troglodytarum]|uniref:Uncharacterized protein n=1 Tax=Musa troglodytarum TaxID=320322 RepID=A0A9E7GMJ3_9LILI|nr:hypothetical protein MUK42_37403 [Musa troglodytarum]
MGCIRLRFLFLVLLICSVTLADSIASGRSALEELTEKNGGAMGVNKVAFLDHHVHHELLNALSWRVISAMLSSQEVHPGSTASRSRWLGGRKMSAERSEKKDTVETGAKPYAGKCKHGGKRVSGFLDAGQAKISEEKMFGSTTKMHDKDSRRISIPKPKTTVKKHTKGSSDEALKPKATAQAASHGSSHDAFQRIQPKKQLDAVNEMFNMLHKDYQTRARRRPPINNDTPLKHLDAKP